jgi:hypothetical protein
MKNNNEVKKAVSRFIDLVSKGWEIDTACLCSHDTVYDQISIDEFINLCKNEVKEIKLTQQN